MSDTKHHRKPGAERTPKKKYRNTGRDDTRLRTILKVQSPVTWRPITDLPETLDLDTSESMKVRRTR